MNCMRYMWGYGHVSIECIGGLLEYFLLGSRRNSSSDSTSRVVESLLEKGMDLVLLEDFFPVIKATISDFELLIWAFNFLCCGW